MAFWVILILIALPLAYIRLAPSDPARWHQRAEPVSTRTETRPGAYIWRDVVTEDEGESKLQALVTVAEDAPRTTHLAGSVADGQITFISRSKVMGFPDYITMGIYTTPEGTRYLEVFSRLRFGGSDLGVNAERVRRWLAAAQI